MDADTYADVNARELICAAVAVCVCAGRIDSQRALEGISQRASGHNRTAPWQGAPTDVLNGFILQQKHSPKHPPISLQQRFTYSADGHAC